MCFPGVSTKDIEVWPADDGELVVSLRGGGAVASKNALATQRGVLAETAKTYRQ